MVAKINRGASLYGAIIYNQQKVNEDTARIIAGNRMITDSLYDPDRIVSQTMFAFESYLAANRNTEKPILHISLNPTLDDNLTDSQFADLARAYMQNRLLGVSVGCEIALKGEHRLRDNPVRVVERIGNHTVARYDATCRLVHLLLVVDDCSVERSSSVDLSYHINLRFYGSSVSPQTRV